MIGTIKIVFNQTAWIMKPDRSGQKSLISCSTWNGCQADQGVKFKIWWMQNIPEGWWTGVGDFDQAAVTLRRQLLWNKLTTS